jgi:predicted enzyme related to lactoylglutathione lyase
MSAAPTLVLFRRHHGETRLLNALLLGGGPTPRVEKINAMSDAQPGTVHWIDHYVICTNDIVRWEAFNGQVLGARTLPNPSGSLRDFGIFQSVGSMRLGGFTNLRPLPETRGLGKGLPRYGFYILAADIDAHLRRLDTAGALHTSPMRISAEGDAGTTIYWQDPDGNQFEFWAPDVLPEGAMHGCGPERVGRLSHAVFESRDLNRTAAFFERYCALGPIANKDIPSDVLALRLAAGGKIVFHKVDELEGRTTGCGLRDAHTALLVRHEDFFRNYARVWEELPEWDVDLFFGEQKQVEDLQSLRTLAPRTALHPSLGGRRFRELTKRGDDIFDWDTNMFHFYGGAPLAGDSLATYDGYSIERYIDEWEKANGNLEALKNLVTV